MFEVSEDLINFVDRRLKRRTKGFNEGLRFVARGGVVFFEWGSFYIYSLVTPNDPRADRPQLHPQSSGINVICDFPTLGADHAITQFFFEDITL